MAKQNFNFIPQNRLNLSPNKEEATEVEKIVTKLEEPSVSMPFNFKFIARDQIEFNSNNSFEQKDIDKLADSILNLGLIHNLEATYDEEKDKYILDSGERRTRALDSLFERFNEENIQKEPDNLIALFNKNISGFKKGYPVNVKRVSEETSKLDMIDAELRLIAANIEVRDDDSIKRLENISKYKSLLQQKNVLLPADSQININAYIAEKEEISERQVRKYNNVLSLIPELQELFKTGDVTLSNSPSLAKLTESEQLEIANLIASGQKLNAKEYQILKDKSEKLSLVISEQEEQIKKAEEEKKEINSKFNLEIERLKQDLTKEPSIKQDSKEIQEKIKASEEKYKAALEGKEKALREQEQKIAELNSQLKETKENSLEADKEKILNDAKHAINIDSLTASLTSSIYKLSKEIKYIDEEQKDNLKSIISDFLERLDI
jgi:GDSL-family lipase/acylhydrolase